MGKLLKNGEQPTNYSDEDDDAPASGGAPAAGSAPGSPKAAGDKKDE